MAWIVAGALGGLGLVTGTLNAAEQRKAKKEELLANAAQIQYSPWTGLRSNVQGMSGTPSVAMGALQGGVAGAMMGSQFNKTAPTASATPVTDGGMQSAPVMGEELVQPTAQQRFVNSLGKYNY